MSGMLYIIGEDHRSGYASNYVKSLNVKKIYYEFNPELIEFLKKEENLTAEQIIKNNLPEKVKKERFALMKDTRTVGIDINRAVGDEIEEVRVKLFVVIEKLRETITSAVPNNCVTKDGHVVMSKEQHDTIKWPPDLGTTCDRIKAVMEELNTLINKYHLKTEINNNCEKRWVDVIDLLTSIITAKYDNAIDLMNAVVTLDRQDLMVVLEWGARDGGMSETIKDGMTTNSDNGASAVVVGQLHVPGIVNRLLKYGVDSTKIQCLIVYPLDAILNTVHAEEELNAAFSAFKRRIDYMGELHNVSVKLVGVDDGNTCKEIMPYKDCEEILLSLTIDEYRERTEKHQQVHVMVEQHREQISSKSGEKKRGSKSRSRSRDQNKNKRENDDRRKNNKHTK